MPIVEAVLGLGPFGVGHPAPQFASGWLERAAKVLEAMGVEVRSRVERIEHEPAEVA